MLSLAGHRQPLKLILAFVALTIFWANAANALSADDLLPPEQAFRFDAEQIGDKIRVSFTAAKGYYLYKDKLDFFSATPGIALLGSPQDFAQGQMIDDPNFGQKEIYRLRIGSDIGFQRTTTQNKFLIKAKFQGCADLGVCYPPQKSTVKITLASASNDVSSTLPQKSILKSITGIGSQANNMPLPVEQAFALTIEEGESGHIIANWQVTPDHYLYKNKLKFKLKSPNGVTVSPIALPEGVTEKDPTFGSLTVYPENFQVVLRADQVLSGPATLETTYQGCSKPTGICYPPVTQTSELIFPTNTASSAASVVKNQTTNLSNGKNNQTGYFATIFLFFIAGLGLAFTPCVFPMIPILSSVVIGQKDITPAKGLSLSLSYVLASAIAYAFIGLFFGYFGSNIQSLLQTPWVVIMFVVLLVFLSLSMFGLFSLQMPSNLQNRLTSISQRQGGGNLAGAAMMGFISTLIVGPCVAPPLAAALGIITQSQDPILGALALFCLGIGMGLPLILIGASAGKWLPAAGQWMNTIKSAFGVMILGLAIWMLGRVISGNTTLFLFGLLSTATGIYIAVKVITSNHNPNTKALQGIFAGILAIAGTIQLIGAAAGGDDVLQPLRPFTAGTNTTNQSESLRFQIVTDLTGIQNALDKAKALNQPTLLNVSAKWCTDCMRMEKNAFQNDTIISSYENWTVIKLDVTEQSEENLAAMKAFNVIGPPTLLIFDAQSSPRTDLTKVGYQSPEDFLEIAETVQSH